MVVYNTKSDYDNTNDYHIIEKHGDTLELLLEQIDLKVLFQV